MINSFLLIFYFFKFAYVICSINFVICDAQEAGFFFALRREDISILSKTNDGIELAFVFHIFYFYAEQRF